MELTKVTITGIDERTDLKRVKELQKRYPFAEFGILLSYDWKENGRRFPDPEILSKFEKLGLNLSAHFCGQAAIDIAIGKRFKVLEQFSSHIRLFHRCQLNLRADGLFSNLRKLPPIPYIDEVIVQMHTPEMCGQFLTGERPRHLAFLLDASGGAGIDTPIRILTSPGAHIGYAGGIGPDNVEGKLRTLLDYDSKEKFWIDMETRVRTDEWLDLDKVEQVFRICASVLKEHEDAESSARGVSSGKKGGHLHGSSHQRQVIKVTVGWSGSNYCAVLSENVPGSVMLTADTYDELLQKVPETLKFHIDGMVADGDEVPRWLLDGLYDIDYDKDPR